MISAKKQIFAYYDLACGLVVHAKRKIFAYYDLACGLVVHAKWKYTLIFCRAQRGIFFDFPLFFLNRFLRAQRENVFEILLIFLLKSGVWNFWISKNFAVQNFDNFTAQSYTLKEKYSLIGIPAQNHLVHAKRKIFAYWDPSSQPSHTRLKPYTAITHRGVTFLSVGGKFSFF